VEIVDESSLMPREAEDEVDDSIIVPQEGNLKADAYLLMKHSMIEEEKEEEEEDNEISINSKTMQPQYYERLMRDEAKEFMKREKLLQKSLLRKKAIRTTIRQEGLFAKLQLSNHEFVSLIRKCLY